MYIRCFFSPLTEHTAFKHSIYIICLSFNKHVFTVASHTSKSQQQAVSSLNGKKHLALIEKQ